MLAQLNPTVGDLEKNTDEILELYKIAVKQKKKVVIGTTGFSKKEENLIKKFSKI